jgi:hypothetical protein
MADEVSAAPPAPEALLKPLGRLLRPLVRLLIRCGVSFPAAAELLRRAFVDVAVRDLLSDPRSHSDSRISLLTGIHRKDVRRLRQLTAGEQALPAAVTLGSQIIARWAGMERYNDSEGKPLLLPRVASAEEPSFEELVRSVTTDVRPRAVLDDLLDQQIVTIQPDDRVALNSAAFIPRRGREEQLFYFSRNLHDHLAAAVANVLSASEPPFLDRSVHYDRLPPEAADELEKIAREAAMAALIDVNRVALAIADAADRKQQTDTSVRRRVNLGVYLYSEDDPSAEKA